MDDSRCARTMAGLGLVAAFALASPAWAQREAAQDYALPAQDLSRSVRAVAAASHRNIIASADLLAGRTAPALVGRHQARQALDILLRGSGLEVEVVGDALLVRPSDRAARPEPTPRAAADDELVITGTRIRGSAPVGAPLITIDRTDIDRSGYATTQQILQSIPQNFGGGPNESTLGASVRNGAGSNSGYGSSLNLRGLGSTSTLVLFNGNRPALGGLSGVFADLSLIPASAIERVEVLTDGASAIYGSDAVAGVANIRFRDRFVGAETRLRIGSADGTATELQAGQLVGLTWSGGGLVVAYEYNRRTRLAADDRTFATEDLRPFGGPDYRSLYANPGTIIAADGRIFGIPRGQDGTALTAADLLPGVANQLDARAGTDILPRQRTHSVYASARQGLTDDLTLSAQGLYAVRRYDARSLPGADLVVTVPVTNPFYVDPIGTGQPVRLRYNFAHDLGVEISSGRIWGASGVLGLRWQTGSWRIELSGSYGEQRERGRVDNGPNRFRVAQALADPDPATSLNLFGDGSFTNPATLARIRGSFESRSRYSVWNGALRADGPLFALPAGEVKLAAGVEYRREAFGIVTISDRTAAAPVVGSLPGLPGPRDILAAYAELLLPLADDDSPPGIGRIDLSLAGRVERYSDVGTTANPRAGLRWQPLPGLRINGSYGRSFRAPNFTELIGSALSFYQPIRVVDPAAPGGFSNVLSLSGYADDIRPETAETWTVGFELHPGILPGVRLSANYFDITYEGRIAATQNVFNYLANRDIYGGLITDNPPPAVIASYYASPFFANPLNLPASSILAIVDGRVQNLSSVAQNGIDADLEWTGSFAGGTAWLGLSGSYLFGIRQRLTERSDPVDVVGTISNPVDLRLRGRAGWSWAGLDIAAFVNHVAGYDNRVVSTIEHVEGWTTVDLRIGYRFPEDHPLGGLTVALSIQNLLDTDPPYVNNRTVFSALGYDPDKASPLGRVVGFQVVRTW